MTAQELEALLGKPKETPSSIPAGKIKPGALNTFNTKQIAHFSCNREKLQKLELERKKERRGTSHFPDQGGLSKERRVMIVVSA